MLTSTFALFLFTRGTLVDLCFGLGAPSSGLHYLLVQSLQMAPQSDTPLWHFVVFFWLLECNFGCEDSLVANVSWLAAGAFGHEYCEQNAGMRTLRIKSLHAENSM